MKRILIFVAFMMVGCSKAQLPMTPGTPTILQVSAVDSIGQVLDSTDVYLNGTKVGTTPYKTENLQPGLVTLRLLKENYHIYTDQLVVQQGEQYNIEAVLKSLPATDGQLLVNVNLDSVLVSVFDANNNKVAETQEKRSTFVLPAGAYLVTGEKEGSEPVQQAVQIDAGKSSVVNLTLKSPNYEPPSLDFQIKQDTVQINQKFELTWNTDGSQVIIDQGIGTRGPSGQETLSSPITGKIIYTATAFGENNLTTQVKDSIYVIPETFTAPSLDFSIVQDSVQINQTFQLIWNTNGNKVVIDQGVGTRGPSGRETLSSPITGKIIYTATAFGENNLTTQVKDSIYVVPETFTAPDLEFSVVQDSVVFGEPVQIQWNSNGFQVVIDQSVGTRGPVGSEEINFLNPGLKIITATAYGEHNTMTSKRDSVFIKEAPAPSRPVIFLSATSTVTVNTPANITWHSQNADYLVVDYVDNPDFQGSEKITFTTPGIRIVTATAFNESGYVTATDTIDVVEPIVDPVDDIIIVQNSSVRADKGEAGMADLNAASFEITSAGTYKVLTEVWYNSGDDQLNESFYLKIQNSSGETKQPLNSNAGFYKVVPDDPGAPHTASRESGQFKLDPGMHSINVFHYAKIANYYPQFINGQIDGAESVHILGFKLVYIGK